MARASGRPIGLTVVRAASLVVGVFAATAGLVYAVLAIPGPKVLWVLDGGPPGVSGLVELPVELRVAHAATVVVAMATVALLSFLLGDLARHVRDGVAFVPAVSRTAWALAVTLLVGSWLAQIGENVAVRSGVLYPDEGDWAVLDPSTLPVRWEIGIATFVPDLPFLGLAVVLGLLSWIVQSGERLQRDTEGLV